ncbi:CBS domain-containing protein CBSX5-like [Cynara cardunculus var. scolymus]|uniref:CBS domain-containing protein CBSX5-like n=1 Tax=Cynara cardunculus var. scolymus TaxID=59895 RepID=UPI000D626754|nr:CBS domain-containing protein CBSX5-like [Cynara cardunculus var. scolymus]
MAIRFLASEISDLCLGKPPLRSLPTVATVADAVFALKKSGEIYVSIWSCDHSNSVAACNDTAGCRCVGKICMVDVIVYLCKEENLLHPLDALQSNVLDLVPKVKGQIRHLEPNSSLLEAIDCILDGAQNLVIPIYSNARRNLRKPQLTQPNSLLCPTLHYGQEFCWLTQEDVVRFLLNSIGVFSPIPTFTIEALDIIDPATLTIHFDDPASSALPLISRSLMDQTSIAVVMKDNRLIGEISPFTLACCDETVAAAITTLSAGDLMAYIDYGGPSDDLVHLVKMRLQERNMTPMLDLMDDYYNPLSSSSSCCSSDEEFGSAKTGCVGRLYPGRRSEAIVCHPWNTLMAVMVQMIALRVSYAWVVEHDYTLVGIVTFAEILAQFRSIAGTR